MSKFINYKESSINARRISPRTMMLLLRMDDEEKTPDTGTAAQSYRILKC